MSKPTKKEKRKYTIHLEAKTRNGFMVEMAEKLILACLAALETQYKSIKITTEGFDKPHA